MITRHLLIISRNALHAQCRDRSLLMRCGSRRQNGVADRRERLATSVGGAFVAALAVFASQLQLLWIVGLALALGNAMGGYLGAHFTVSRGEKFIRLVLNIVLIAFIIKLLFNF